MFFNGRGILITLAALAAVVLVCVLDVHCSNVRDRAAAEPPAGGAMARVKGELHAGREAFAQQRLDQVNTQLRDMRLLAKHLVKNGENRRARATLALIQELEQQKARLEKSLR